jgi:HlyD family secretion protein
VADHQVTLVAEVSGQVLELLVDVGDRVAAGDPLVRVDSTILEAQRAQALAGLEAAKAQYDLLVAGADDADLAAARAAVAAANAAYQRAVEGITDEDRRLAESQLRLAQAAVTTAQAAYNEVRWMPNIGAMPQSLQLQQATLQVEAAQAQYDKVVKGATQDVIAGAYAQLAQARAQLQRLQEGAKPEQVQAAQAQVSQAETALYLAQVQLNKATARSPIDGVIARVSTSAGSMAAPGAPLLVILSNDVRVNIPVEETRLGSLRIGQPARVRVDAYPDRIFNGEVSIIAPELDPSTRTVQVTIRPQDEERRLAPGMSATVELLENQGT